MYEGILTPRQTPVVTPEQLATFGRFDVPQQYVTGSSPQTLTDDWAMAELFIDAATDQVETMAAQACLNEQIVLTFDLFPNTQDPRHYSQYEISYAYTSVAPTLVHRRIDSIELIRRPVIIPTLAGSSSSVSAVSVSNNQVTVECVNNFAQGNVVMLQNTAEGNTAQPSLTPATTPFLNGVPLTVLTASGTSFTAAFNFYTVNGQSQIVAQSYTNNSDTGTATLINNPLIVTYNDINGVLQTWSTINYTVQYDKICLNVGNSWPTTDKRQDCVQVTYWAGNSASDPTKVPKRLQMAVLYLANHFWNIRDTIAVETTNEIGMTLCKLLSSFRSMRIPG